MKFTWREKVTVVVGEMDRASALDCYRAISDLSELPDGATRTLQALTDFVIRLAVEKAPAAVTYDGRVYRASVWAAYGIATQSPKLSCHGYNCKCELVATQNPCTPGKPPRMTG